MAMRDEVIAKVNEFNASTCSLDFSYFKVSNNLGLYWGTESGSEYSDRPYVCSAKRSCSKSEVYFGNS